MDADLELALVLPAKIFEIKGEASIGDIYENLKSFREEESYELADERDINLITEVLDLKQEENI